MGQRRRDRKKSRHSDASMDDGTSFDSLFKIDLAADSRLIAFQENLISLEEMAAQTLEKFLPRSVALAKRIKRKVS